MPPGGLLLGHTNADILRRPEDVAHGIDLAGNRIAGKKTLPATTARAASQQDRQMPVTRLRLEAPLDARAGRLDGVTSASATGATVEKRRRQISAGHCFRVSGRIHSQYVGHTYALAVREGAL